MAHAERGGSGPMISMMDDPFVSKAEGGPAPRESHRYSSFDTQLFSLDASSPAQAKRALEAHLAETERRLEEASKLGTALIQQQKELEDKLKEVEQQQEQGQIGPELRRKLADLEREYNEIGRETARAFLGPKRLAGGDDVHFGTPSFDQKSPLSPALFAGQATSSPSKVSVPSRKQRNQPSSRVHDIEFATEISTSLLAQVRQLQSLLAEREDALKTVNLEKSRLEIEAEGYAQRIRALDESEERYKDENWALETRTHELLAAVKDAADRESRLNSSLGAVATEKSTVERELEDLKQANAKLVEDHAAAQKANDSEIHLLRRNLNAGDAEKQALQRKLEELNSQNQELAKAVAMRLRQHEAESTREIYRRDDSDDQDQATPENSPPPSPSKFTPRHNHLETETLRSSLGHAHRMIQNLRSTIHREKTEKIELKRMLQEARDEVEQRRRDSANPAGASNKRHKTKTDSMRKPARPDLLGAGRKKAEIEIHDSDWEDNAGDISPSRKAPAKPRDHAGDQSTDERSDAYQTATEAEDSFETANERETATESEAFQTGVESMADDSTDSDELTETEERVQRTPRERVSSLTLAKARDRTSYYSTASTSADEDESEEQTTPSASQNSTPRYRLRTKRSVLRRIRPSGEAPMAFGSRPSSARESPATSFDEGSGAQEGQSLFAELAELDGDEDDEGSFGPPMRFDAGSRGSTPRVLAGSDSRRPSEIGLPPAPRPVMVDSGVMTEPWEPAVSMRSQVIPEEIGEDVPTTPKRITMSDASTATEEKSPKLVSSATQWTPLKPTAVSNGDQVSSVPTPPKMMWDGDAGDRQREEESVPPSPTQLDVSSISSQETTPVAPRLPDLSTSYFVGGTTEPVAHLVPEPAEITLSSIASQSTRPVEPIFTQPPEPEPEYVPNMILSQVFCEETPPVVATLPEPDLEPTVSFAEQGTSTDTSDLVLSAIFSQQTEPVVPSPVVEQPVEVIADEVLPELAISYIPHISTEPIAPQVQEVSAPLAPQLSLSTVRSEETLPVDFTPAITIIPAPQFNDENPLTTLGEKAVNSKPNYGVSPLVVVEDSSGQNSTGDAATGIAGTTLPLTAISGNAAARQTRASSSNPADQGAQTILSSKQIDQILMERVSSRPLSPPESDKAKELSNSPFATPKARPRTHQSSTASLPFNHRRPGSAASQASSLQSHPPLPADHKEVILAAEKKSLELRPTSAGLMGPPLAPASAYRTNVAQRPRTPNDTGTQVGSAKTATSRVSMRRESQMSRRSSVSSFASELEERFNMQPNPGLGPQGYAVGTDPRMIQAITQTMIGEFLWKYTRKAVSGEISSTRHRRYFWVHPYTRTLYWSEQDPQTAVKSELRTKSVFIEAVRVVADDNPYPPGLHCKSLEVVSPGRRIRFTATTSQRHETWFNALSYLLLRNEPEDEEQENITLEDIDEFNPGFRSHSRQTARLSVSSSQTRTSRTAPKQRSGSAMSLRHNVTPGRVSPALSTPSQYSDQVRHSSTSRLSTIFNSTIKGSFGRKGPGYATSSVHEGSVHTHDSEEDLRQMMERQDQDTDRLENVRACCDGKHDVGSLSRTSRYSPRANRIHSHH